MRSRDFAKVYGPKAGRCTDTAIHPPAAESFNSLSGGIA